jgi:flagellar hook-basal body protein
MPNYSIGLSGLQQSSNAMDVISNNISNASTVGYRAGEFIFEDQFYKAMNPMDPARAGMGAAKQNIRRLWNMGAIQQSANSLDMAITGSMGLFRLTSNADDPAQTFYSRNGQFAISKEVDPSYPKRSYIVNENGMFLTGYTSADGKTLTSTHTHRLTMPPVSVDPVTTQNSTVSVTLDARKTAFIPEANVAFDPEVPSSYSNKVAQTVYHLGDSGNPHTLELYYRRIEDRNMSISYDGTYLKFKPNSVADPKASTEPQGAVIEQNASYVVLTQEASGPNFDYLSSANRKTNATIEQKDKSYINVNVNADIDDLARVIVNGKDTGVVKKAVDTVASYARAFTTEPAAAAAEVSTHTITDSGTLRVGDIVNFQVKGKIYTHSVTQANIDTGNTPTAVADALAISLEADKATLGLSSAAAAAGVITLTAATNNDPLSASSWSTRSAQSTGTAAASKTASANAATAEINRVTLGGGFKEGDRVSISLQGQTFTYTVTSAAAASGVAAVRDGLYAEIDKNKTALGILIAKVDTTTDAAGTAVAKVTAVAQQDTVTLAGTYVAGDTVTITVGGAALTYTVDAGDIVAGDDAATRENIATQVADEYNASLNAAHTPITASAAADVITLTADTAGVAFTASASEVTAGNGTATRAASVANVAAAAGKVTLTPSTLTDGDVVKFTVQGGALQSFTVSGQTTVAQLATAINNAVTATTLSGVSASVVSGNLVLTATDVTKNLTGSYGDTLPNNGLTITASETDDPLDIQVSVNKAIQLSSALTVAKDDEVMFFNPVTTASPGSAVTTASDTITTATTNSAIEVGQYLWARSKGGTFTQLDAKVIEISGKQLKLDKAVTLAADDQIVFYQPVTYTVMLQDGSKVMMTGEHKRNAAADTPQLFTAVTSQVEVYSGLDGTMFNGMDSRFSSDTAITPTVRGTYKPVATIQFWGGQNIDAIRFDATTGEPSFQTLVQLKGIVTSSGKTNGPGDLAISEDHPLEFDLDLTGTQHFATAFSVDANFQDGYPTAMLNNVVIDPEGKLVGTYSDGREFIAGQVVLVNFAAVNGLVPSGGNVFQASYMSGAEINENVIVGRPGERGLGGIRAGSYEGSNVDLANELVKLLIQQRMYSANSQSIRAFDDTLTTTIRMTGG